MSTQEMTLTVPQNDLMARLGEFILDPRVEIEKLNGLLDFQLRLKVIEAKRIYDDAMFEVQAELPEIVKDGVIDMGTKGKIPFPKLESVMRVVTPILKAHGFGYGYTSEDSGDKGVLMTLTIVQRQGGHRENSSLRLPADSMQATTIKGIGSARSYAKRYLILDMLGITVVDLDDDANSAVRTINTAEAKQVNDLIALSGADRKRFLDVYQIDNVEDMPLGSLKGALEQLRARIANRKASAK